MNTFISVMVVGVGMTHLFTEMNFPPHYDVGDTMYQVNTMEGFASREKEKVQNSC